MAIPDFSQELTKSTFRPPDQNKTSRLTETQPTTSCPTETQPTCVLVSNPLKRSASAIFDGTGPERSPSELAIEPNSKNPEERQLKSENQMNGLEGLPHVILHSIVEKLDPQSYRSLSLSSRTLFQKCNDDVLRKKIIINEIKFKHPELDPFVKRFFPRDVELSRVIEKDNLFLFPRRLLKLTALLYRTFEKSLGLEDQMLLTLTEHHELLPRELPPHLHFGFNVVEIILLETIPEAQRTFEVCKQAVLEDFKNIIHVPDDGSLTDQEYQKLCELAITNPKWKDIFVLNSVPEKNRHYEICRIALRVDIRALLYINPNLLNLEEYSELCEFVFKQNGCHLEHVPNEYRNATVCKLAVTQNGWALKHVPDQYLTDELCQLAVKQNGFALHGVPDQYLTR